MTTAYIVVGSITAIILGAYWLAWLITSCEAEEDRCEHLQGWEKPSQMTRCELVAGHRGPHRHAPKHALGKQWIDK